MVADKGGEKDCGLGLAGVGRYEVLAVGVFIEAVTGPVDGDGAGLGGARSLDLHADCAFEDVADDGAGVTVRPGGFAGLVVDLNDLKLEIVSFEMREALGDDGADLCRRRLMLGWLSLRRRWGCRWQGRVADDGEDVGPAFDEGHGKAPPLLLSLWRGADL